MPLANIIDHRDHKFRFRKINVALEATWHDNSCVNSDQVEAGEGFGDGPNYEERIGISLAEAVAWANTFPAQVTLYIYDEGKGIE